VSGKRESVDRLAWSGLMTALHANGVSVVIIEKLDRLARDRMVQETIIADLRKHGFEVVSVAEWLNTRNPNARIRKRAKEGRCEGRKSYGYYEGEGGALERLKALGPKVWALTESRRVRTKSTSQAAPGSRGMELWSTEY